MRASAARVFPGVVDSDMTTAIRSWIRRRQSPGVWLTREQPKPDGGTRTIHAPCDALKHLLRGLNHRYFAPIDTDPHCHCRKGTGVLKAVRLHRAHPALLHRDLMSFFPSVTRDRIRKTLTRRGYAPRIAADFAAICTVNGVLPQGSPTSVSLANLVLAGLDARIGTLCRDNGLTYTRYVDDIAVSGGEVRLAKIELLIDRIIEDDGWLCGSKGGFFPAGSYREYLGVNIGDELRVGAKAKSKAILAHEALERGEITHDEFAARLGWVRAVEGPSLPSLS